MIGMGTAAYVRHVHNTYNREATCADFASDVKYTLWCIGDFFLSPSCCSDRLTQKWSSWKPSRDGMVRLDGGSPSPSKKSPPPSAKKAPPKKAPPPKKKKAP